MSEHFHKISNEEYHHGPEWGPMLSASKIKPLITKTPAHFRYGLDHPTKTTAAMEFGSAVHTAVLEPETLAVDVARLDKIDRRTKAGKAAYAEFCEANQGKIILKSEEYDKMLALAAAVANHATASNLLENLTEREVSIKWFDPDFGCWCKARPDALGFDVFAKGQNVVADLKTTSKDAKTFRFAVSDFDYFLQAAWYLRGLSELTKKVFEWIWIAVETDAPHCVSVHQANDIGLMIAEDVIKKAGAVYKECNAKDYWPGWSCKIRLLELPSNTAARYTNFLEAE